MELSELEAELCRDDTTSCTSSLATTISLYEDTEELHLGAEANSFDLRTLRREQTLTPEIFSSPASNDPSTNERSRQRKGLMVMKEIHSSFESNDTNVTYSSISSLRILPDHNDLARNQAQATLSAPYQQCRVVNFLMCQTTVQLVLTLSPEECLSVIDLLKARECDIEEMLVGLGFASYCEEQIKRDILTRFMPKTWMIEDDAREIEPPTVNIETVENTTRVEKPEYDASINKTKEWLDMHHSSHDTFPNTIEKIHPNKVIPLFEQPVPDLAKRPSPQRTSKLRRRFSKSRQSSFELLLPKLNEEDGNLEVDTPTLGGVETSPYSPIPESAMEQPASLPQSPLETWDVGNKNDKVMLNQPTSICTHSSLVQVFPDHSSPSPHELDKGFLMDDLSVVKPTKTSLLQSGQLESFELEEIYSNNEDWNDLNKQNRPGSSNSNSGRDQAPLDPLVSRKPTSDRDSDDKDSSSGFGESTCDDNVESCSSEEPCRTVHPHTVIESMKVNLSSSKPMSSSPANVHFVFDVPLGCPVKKEPMQSGVVEASNSKGDNEATVKKRSLSETRSKSLGALPRYFIPLHGATTSQTLPKLPYAAVVTPKLDLPCERAASSLLGLGKCRRLMSDMSKCTKELVSQLAGSGDKIEERHKSLLVRHKGRFLYRKRRPGSLQYYGSAEDIPSTRFKAALQPRTLKDEANRNNANSLKLAESLETFSKTPKNIPERVSFYQLGKSHSVDHVTCLDTTFERKGQSSVHGTTAPVPIILSDDRGSSRNSQPKLGSDLRSSAAPASTNVDISTEKPPQTVQRKKLMRQKSTSTPNESKSFDYNVYFSQCFV